MENASPPASPDAAGSDGAITPATAPAAPVATEPTQADLDAHGFNPADYEWMPLPRRPRSDGWSFERQRQFVEALADTGSVAESARTIGMSVQSCYRLRRSPGAEGFAAAWDAAIAQAGKGLLDLAFERVTHGEDIPIFDKTGQRIGARRRYSDRMMMFLLRGFYPDRFGRARIDGDGRDSVAQPAPREMPMPLALSKLAPALPAEPQWVMQPGALEDLIANQRESERFYAAHPEIAAREAEQDAAFEERRSNEPARGHDWDPFIPATDQPRFDRPAPPPPVLDWVADLRLKTSAEERAAREGKRNGRRKKGTTP